MLRETTVCFPVKGDPIAEVLLGYKKINFGQGKITGFGGKVEPGETVPEATVRELYEEINISFGDSSLHPTGTVRFTFPANPGWSQTMYVFTCRDWSGVPMESAEIRPQWFKIEDIPWRQMWQDAQLWLPFVLRGTMIDAQIVLDDDNESVKLYNVILQQHQSERRDKE